MAGGKETPRQKMIGMMYLVLTALLALNVSKSILDAFVSFDNNIKDGTVTIASQGSEAYLSLKELSETGEDGKKEKALKYFPIAEKIKLETTKRINFLNSLRDTLLFLTGEDKSIIRKQISKGIYSYDLDKIEGKDNYDIPMQLMIGSEIKNPDKNKSGMKLWRDLKTYRNVLTETLSSYDDFTFSAKAYEEKSTIENLQSVSSDDREVVKQIFNNLTKNEFADIHDGEIKNVHWVGRTFDHAPIVAAMATLSSIEQEIRTAEAIALRHLRAKLGGSDYSFNSIKPLAYASSNYYNTGDSISLDVMMAAYDSYTNPQIEFNLDSSSTNEASPLLVKDGKGTLKIKAQGAGVQKIKGTITINKKNGTTVKKPWEFQYAVGKPSGAISLPEMNLLYRGKENKVVGAASGFQGYTLSMTNGSITKKGEYWDARPGSGRNSTITITGVSGDSRATLGAVNFRVQNLPAPDLVFGSIVNGSIVSGSTINANNRLFLKYQKGIPLNSNLFTISKYEVISGPRPGKGPGSTLKDEVRRQLRMAASGETIIIKAFVNGPSVRNIIRTMTFTKR